MDFVNYKAKLYTFHNVFVMLFGINQNEIPTSERRKINKEILMPALREWMANPQLNVGDRNAPYISIPLIDYIKDNGMVSLNNVNLAGDLETLTRQAEAIKNEIITLGKLFSLMPRFLVPKGVLRLAVITDFIRTPGGKIVDPFDYWEDCVEVYSRKHLLKHSNEKIAKEYNFKTSKSATMRAKQKLVADMLIEIDHLKNTVFDNNFPPRVLSGAKQPRMIIKG